MFPYLLLLAAPSGPTIMAARRSGLLLLAVALLYWFMIGWRFQVGVDWNNYLYIYNAAKDRPLGDLILDAEPGFRALLWLASLTGGGIILVNVVSALVFCFGFFAMAKRCQEPFLAITVATPLAVIVTAMSGIRQAMAMGIIYYLFATWDKRATFGRAVLVAVAVLFHVSAVFVGIFVALGSRMSPLNRIAAAMFVLAGMGGIIWFFPEPFEFYSQTYLGEGRLTAPGALFHVVPLAAPALVYFIVRKRWQQVLGESELFKYLAIAALAMVPAVYISSIGASRISLYFWPLAMYVWSGLPALIQSGALQVIYRVMAVVASFMVLVLWLQLANNSSAFLPYRNWFWEPEYSSLYRDRVGRR